MIVKNQDSIQMLPTFLNFSKKNLKSTPIRNIFPLQNTDDFPNYV